MPKANDALREDIEKDMSFIKDACFKASEYGLLIEMLYTHVNVVKSNPNMPLEESLKIAMDEWDI